MNLQRFKMLYVVVCGIFGSGRETERIRDSRKCSGSQKCRNSRECLGFLKISRSRMHAVSIFILFYIIIVFKETRTCLNAVPIFGKNFYPVPTRHFRDSAHHYYRTVPTSGFGNFRDPAHL